MKKQKKEAGFIVSAELVLIATILVIGLIVGMVAIRDAMTAEMHDVAEAIGALDQSYSFEGILDLGTNAEVAGTSWSDSVDTGAGDQLGINYDVAPITDEGGL
jgi:hypothetical protein